MTYKKLITKFIRLFYKKYNYVFIWKLSEDSNKYIREKYDIYTVTSTLVDPLELSNKIDYNCRYHNKFPRYCINGYGLKRKVYYEKGTNYLYYNEKGNKYYLKWE